MERLTPGRRSARVLVSGGVPWYRQKTVLIAACLLLVASVAVYVLARQGRSSGSSQPWVDFAPGAPVTPTFAVNPGSAEAIAAQLPYARRLQDPVDITVSAPAEGARITFPVDPSADLTPTGGKTPTVGNYFIASYNQSLSSWIPLPTTYDPATQTITAVAPHFSDYSSFLVDGYTDITGLTANATQAIATNGQDVLSAIEDAKRSAGAFLADSGAAFIDIESRGLVVIGNGINGAVTGLQEAAAALMEKILDVTWPDQKDANCTAVDADQHYTVTFELPLLSGCVHTQSTNTELRVQDAYLVPFDIMTSPQPGVKPALAEIGERDLSSVLLSLAQFGLGNVFVAGRDVNSADMSLELAGQASWSVSVSADTNAIVLGTVLAVISVLPPAKEYEAASTEISAAVRTYIAEHSDFEMQDLLTEVKRMLHEPKDSGHEANRSTVAVIDAISSGYQCLRDIESSVDGVVKNGITPETFGEVFHSGVACAEIALTAYGKALSQPVKDALGILTALPKLVLALPKDLANAGLTDGQAVRIGAELTSSTMSVTYDPTKNSPNCLLVGQCRDLSIPCGQPRDLDSLSPEFTALNAMYADDYHGQYVTSRVVQLCGGGDTVVVAYGADTSLDPPKETVDVRTWDEPSKKWLKTANFPAEPYLPVRGSESVEVAHLTDGAVDFLVPGSSMSTANGYTVVSVKDGAWRTVPFQWRTGSTPTNYVPAAVHTDTGFDADVNDCLPNCAGGTHTTGHYTYDASQQMFVMAAACDSSAAPAIDDTAQYAIHLDLDGYYRPYERSMPVPVCGSQVIVVAYADSENATSSPAKIDVRAYNTKTKQWEVVQTLDPHDLQNASIGQPYVPAETSCPSGCIQPAHVTDGDIDFLVQGGNATLANGLTVVSEKNGVWRMVPFLDKPPATGSTNYVPAATLSGNEILVDLDDCKPDCATGGHSTVAYTYDRDRQGFAGTLTDATVTTAGDLGLTVPIANLSCTGQYVRLVGSSTDPGKYRAETQSFLDAHPGSSYLLTDQSCAAFVSSVDGNQVYAAYLGPFPTAAQACTTGGAADATSYVKVLNNTTTPDAALVTC